MIQNSRKLSELNNRWKVLLEGDNGNQVLPPLHPLSHGASNSGEDFEINYGINDETVAKLLIGITIEGETEYQGDPDERFSIRSGPYANQQFIITETTIEQIKKVIDVYNPITGEPIPNANITVNNFKQLVGQDLFKVAETGLLLNEEGTGPISQDDLYSQLEYLHKNNYEESKSTQSLTESSRYNCEFFEFEPNKWYYALDDREPENSTDDWINNANITGPFDSETKAENYLGNHEQNPGDWDVLRYSSFQKHPFLVKKYAELVKRAKRRPGRDDHSWINPKPIDAPAPQDNYWTPEKLELRKLADIVAVNPGNIPPGPRKKRYDDALKRYMELTAKGVKLEEGLEDGSDNHKKEAGEVEKTEEPKTDEVEVVAVAVSDEKPAETSSKSSNKNTPTSTKFSIKDDNSAPTSDVKREQGVKSSGIKEYNATGKVVPETTSPVQREMGAASGKKEVEKEHGTKKEVDLAHAVGREEGVKAAPKVYLEGYKATITKSLQNIKETFDV